MMKLSMTSESAVKMSSVCGHPHTLGTSENNAVVGHVGEILERWQVKLDSEVSNANHPISRNRVECTCGEHPLSSDRNSL